MITNNNKKLAWALAVPLFFLLWTAIASFFWCSDAQGTIDTFYVHTNDTYMRSTDANYTTVHDMEKPDEYYSSTLTTGRVGQISWAGLYYEERSFLPVDASALDDAADISAAALLIYIAFDWSDTDFDILILKGLWSSSPPESAAYEFGVGFDTTAIGGSFNTSGMGVGWIAIPIDSLNWISKTGITKFTLISSRDLNRSVPTGDEHMEMRSENYAGTDFDPFLRVVYTPGAPSEGQVIIINFGD